MVLDRQSPDALYVQLASDLRERIRTGDLTGRVPSIKDLSADYDVSEDTVRMAISVLKEEGTVVTSRGRGTFVVTGR